MKCLSCADPIGQNGRLYENKILLCHRCHELATAARQKVTALLNRTRDTTYEWLEQSILSGGLLRGSVNPPDIDPTRSNEGAVPSSKEE